MTLATRTASDAGAPFGVHRPSALQNRWRRLAGRLPDTALGRKAASLLLGPAGGRARRPRDISVFGTEKARLHPYDNICEKRVYLTPQHWDPAERAFLAARIASGERTLTFVDIGANAGLYSLFAASAARAVNRAIRIVAIEADPVMCVRMAFNFEASNVKATILPYAATKDYGAVNLAVNRKSRGQSRLVDTGGDAVEGAPIHAMLAERGVSSVDIMKIDIEGHEYPALETFFAAAPEALRPRLLMLETSHERPEKKASALVAGAGYRPALTTRLNTIFEISGRTD